MVGFDEAKRIAADNRDGMASPTDWEEYERGFVFSMDTGEQSVGGFDSPFAVMKDDGSVRYGAISMIMCGELGEMVGEGKL